MRQRSKSKSINTCTRPTCTGPPHGVRHTRAPHVKHEHPRVHVRRHEAVTIGTAGAHKTGMAAYKMTLRGRTRKTAAYRMTRFPILSLDTLCSCEAYGMRSQSMKSTAASDRRTTKKRPLREGCLHLNSACVGWQKVEPWDRGREPEGPSATKARGEYRRQ